jgi:hypothetical protein
MSNLPNMSAFWSDCHDIRNCVVQLAFSVSNSFINMATSGSIGAANGGAAIQVVARGSATYALSGRPAVTHWRWRHKTHTNFALDQVMQNFGSTVQFGATAASAQLQRAGDLAYRQYIVFDLPALTTTVLGITATSAAGFPYVMGVDTGAATGPYVPSYEAAAGIVNPLGGYFCHYVNAVGFRLLKQVRVQIGSLVIDKVSADYLYALEELQGKAGRCLQDMIGKQETREQLIAWSSVAQSLYVPLPFFYTTLSGSALALATLSGNNVTVSVDFEALSKLIIVSHSNVTAYKGTSGAEVANTDLAATILTEYVYLDTAERDIFSNKPRRADGTRPAGPPNYDQPYRKSFVLMNIETRGIGTLVRVMVALQALASEEGFSFFGSRTGISTTIFMYGKKGALFYHSKLFINAETLLGRLGKDVVLKQLRISLCSKHDLSLTNQCSFCKGGSTTTKSSGGSTAKKNDGCSVRTTDTPVMWVKEFMKECHTRGHKVMQSSGPLASSDWDELYKLVGEPMWKPTKIVDIADAKQDQVGVRAGAAVTTEDRRAVVEDLRVTTAAEDLGVAEDRRAAAEDRRAAAEDRVAAAEDRRAAAEDRVAAAEDHRAAAEDHRAAAEDRRAVAEDRRATAEDRRAAAEDRVAAVEDHRVAVEDHRVATAAEKRRVATVAAQELRVAAIIEDLLTFKRFMEVRSAAGDV